MAFLTQHKHDHLHCIGPKLGLEKVSHAFGISKWAVLRIVHGLVETCIQNHQKNGRQKRYSMI